MKKWVQSAVSILFCVAATPALAAEGDRYVGLMGSYVSPDSARNVDDGIGARALFGYMFNERTSWEVSIAGYQADHDYDSESLTVGTLGADLRYLLGSGGIAPFLIGGFAYGYNDEPDNTQTVPSANVGLGLLAQFSERLSLRAEARYVGMFREDLVPGENQLFDARADIGLQMHFAAAQVPAYTPPPAPPVEVVQLPDNDADGVPDGSDQCPDTPAGIQVDAVGCPLPPPVVTVDSDADTVVDAVDTCSDTPNGMQVDTNGCAKKEQTLVLRNIHFESDSAQLIGDSKSVLDGIYNGMVGQPGMRLHITGHTDSTADDDHNLLLSRARAVSVRSYLMGRGIDRSRLSSDGKGESEPVSTNDTEEGKALNRRVEFKVLEQ